MKITNVNKVSTNISLSTSSINENISANTVVATISTVTNPFFPFNSEDYTHTYSLVAGSGDSDNDKFSVELYGNGNRIYKFSENGDIESRVVVLRKFDPKNMILNFHTDFRSPKVKCLKKSNMTWYPTYLRLLKM